MTYEIIIRVINHSFVVGDPVFEKKLEKKIKNKNPKKAMIIPGKENSKNVKLISAYVFKESETNKFVLEPIKSCHSA